MKTVQHLLSLCVLLVCFMSISLFSKDAMTHLVDKKSILSHDSNPSLLSMYPMYNIYFNQGIFGIQEHNFKKNFDSLVSNVRYAIGHNITATSENGARQQQKSFLNVANMIYPVFYDFHTRGSGIYKVPFSTYIGLQFSNIGFSITKDSLNGAYFKFDSGVDENFISNASLNKDNYAFGKNSIASIVNNKSNKLYIARANITQYALSYANYFMLPKSKFHFGASLKYTQSSLYKNALNIHQLTYDQLMLHMNSNINSHSPFDQTLWGMDMGMFYQLDGGNFAIGYVAKDFKIIDSTSRDANSTTPLVEDNIIIDSKHMISVYYKYDAKTLANFNIDLAPVKNYFDSKSSRYAHFKISKNFYKKHQFQLGVKKDLESSVHKVIYMLGYSITKGRATFDVDYQFSDYNIDGENFKQYDMLKLYMSYRL